jgi:predicted regulator of Ras-like GTPase activity (Roadblock/LC7/MglB family)
MATLPQLIEEDIQSLNEILRGFIAKADATAALIIDKGGFLITYQGETRDFDVTTIGALSSGAYLANQTIAGLVHETNFNSVYQQGENSSLLVVNVDEHCLLVVIFSSAVGVVKYFAAGAVPKIARQLQAARERSPGQGIDLSLLNVADTQDVFRKKKSGGKKPRAE